MKKLTTVAVIAMLAWVVGCSEHNTSGGPGSTSPDKNRLTQSNNTFSLDAPNLATHVKQGETKTINIGITRGTNFDQDVRLEFSGAPQGVRITSDNAIRAAEKTVPVKITADKDAALGEHTVTVTGSPAREGSKATSTFKLQVNRAD